ncbi:hypothetical protein [Elizabethkingia anophelis]|uniref:hypothetical protein n=1 Tax=Elizabethkingia anophelis TaxID=1117645 RepID=UPI0020B24072|nr:hypothetical protein [Elizabethkingia anophelis]UTF97544.1 hypothetical protein J2N94_04505 [Elizabethkingia anophelis]
MKQVEIFSHPDCQKVQQAFNKFAGKGHKILEVQSHVTVNDYTLVVTYDDTSKRNTYTLSSGSQKIELKEGQSPRGLRIDDKRPDLILIDCHNAFNSHSLGKYIGWLDEVNRAMKL